MSSNLFLSLNTRLQEKAKQLRESYIAEDLHQFVSQLTTDTKDYRKQLTRKLEEIGGANHSTSSVDGTSNETVDVLSTNERFECLPDDTKERIRMLVRSEVTYTEDVEGCKVADEEECNRVASEWKNDEAVSKMHQKLVDQGDIANDKFWKRFAANLHRELNTIGHTSDQRAEDSDVGGHTTPTPQSERQSTSSPEGRLAGNAYDEDSDNDDDDIITWD
ncbi:hypothetical protein Pmar_PMAR003012 [Perkinsus marinus ATCC 50983]|uniref:Uncharacterized protein n=1 Tax=Perkinsus marinus (strain ATCC 50983 / TXsc) TaxID=423536 RepID=C5LR56_PERM5|nr:hypothetical protein Pmar_PMAR003012 [Perkinsus marinus ATCC 50983]EER00941.1 hypothetical protein Pmar_PMAR003012 [Perkinsus marinus ATCC 50983]|eukprot:XP_002768223.1 hypothetical protein Pmar_PMAR003012 [Perkinsus marinus ATCC 50983]